MTKAAASLKYFSFYLFALGAVLVLAPNLLLSAFDIPETQEVWIRVVGVLVLIIGYYYFLSSRHEVKAFFRWSVHARFSILIFFAAFVLLGYAPPILVLFGVVDAGAALWTVICLRNE